MKKVMTLVAALCVAASAAGALDLPGGGGKIDTAKIDAALAAIKDIEGKFAAGKGKLAFASNTLNDIAANHSEVGDLNDPTTLAALGAALAPDERAQLEGQADSLKALPADFDYVSQNIPIALQKVGEALADVATQISQNPTAAGDLTKHQDKLNEGKAALEQITKDLPGLITAANDLIAELDAII